MIQSQVLQLGYATSPGWTLNSGTGHREFHTSDIKFNPPFSAPPRVALALSGVDGDRMTNLRVQLEAFDVGADEFNINVITWDDTVIYQVFVTWIAYD